MKDFYGILGAGAFGGALSWLWAFASLGVPLKLAPELAAIASILLGAGASVIGVYLLANTDRKDIGRTLAFAILCGFSWQIVYEAGTSTMERKHARDDLKEASSNLTDETKQLADAPEETRPDLVKSIVGNATVLLESSGRADSYKADEAAVKGAISALDAIGQASPNAKPENTTTAVEQIATTAIESGHQQVATRAIETLSRDGLTPADKVALEKIAAVADVKKDPATARLARRAILNRNLEPIAMRPQPVP